MKGFLLLLVVVLGCFFYFETKAIGGDDILINEVAWMGSTNSANDEWIELFNTTNKNIDISDWVLKSSDEKLKIPLRGYIKANGFYLLERTDNSSIPNIKADLIYRGALNNNGMDIKIHDSLGSVIEEADFSFGWPKGDNITKQTMERTSSGTWQTSSHPNGTPGTTNSSGAVKIAPQDVLNQNAVLLELKKIDNKSGGDIKEKGATLSQNFNQLNPLLIFIISLVLVLVSGGVILYFKFTRSNKI